MSSENEKTVVRALAKAHAFQRAALVKNAETQLRAYVDEDGKTDVDGALYYWVEQDGYLDIYAGVYNVNTEEAAAYMGDAWHLSPFPTLEVGVWVEAATNIGASAELVAEFRRIDEEGL